MTTDRNALLDLVDAVERLAVHGHEHLRETAARARRHVNLNCGDCGHRKDEHERPYGCARCACPEGYWGGDEEDET
jgi:hypothetical protein